LVAAVHDYYKDLYTSLLYIVVILMIFLFDAPRLDEIDSSLCEGHVTYNECLKAIKSMKNEKSPGPDGLPAEFYKNFFIYSAMLSLIWLMKFSSRLCDSPTIYETELHNALV
jgi:hypothetical protein